MTSSAVRESREPRTGEPGLAVVERAVRASWSRDTCDECDADAWSPANPARGQCGSTALTVHDLFGGELLVAEVWWADGRWQGYHWWNRLPGGQELDLTREQFGPDEIVQLPRVIDRPPGRPRRCAAQYELLRDRVLAAIVDSAVVST
ncbi:hypothetical protein [Pseudonocardia sp. KRD291]|uniref:YunG family protein n=1 Tax=Pseudonocardia sp. KRD291 TaxID=2792007 RepID=UPI001C4A3DFF|nr:hypothetical protein [Pseudonocardia sp. KRD291]